MSFLREILDEFVIGWDEKRYDKWKEKDDRRERSPGRSWIIPETGR